MKIRTNKLFSAAGLASCLTLASCATNPIYSEFKADETATIVRALRCEVRQALFDEMVRILDKRDPQFFEGQPTDRKAINKYFTDLRPWDVPLAPAMIIMRYYASGISYSLDLDVKEADKSKLDSTLTKNGHLKGRSRSVRSMVNVDQTRQGLRGFDFSENLGDYQEIKCHEPELNASRNLLYPIKGRIGIEGTVETYIELASITKSNEFIYKMTPNEIASAKTLLQAKTFSDEQNGATNAMTDTLTFTTVIGGSIAPTLILEPMAAIWRSTSLGGSLGRIRTSEHKIIVGIAPPSKLKSPVEFRRQMNCIRNGRLGDDWAAPLFADGPDACPKTAGRRISRQSGRSSARATAREAARKAVEIRKNADLLSRSLADELR